MNKVKFGSTRWREGFSFPVDAPTAKLELDKIRKANKGRIAAKDVVQAAKHKTNALHPCFEWDVKKAANAHWLETARLIMRSLEVVRKEAPDVPTRYLETVRQPPEKGMSPRRCVYMKTEDILKDPAARKELLNRALGEADSYRRRYRALEELSSILRAIDRTTKKYSGPPGDGKRRKKAGPPA